MKLPTSAVVNAEVILDIMFDKDLNVDDAITEYLTELYGFCVYSCEYEYCVEHKTYRISNIKWDRG